MESKIIRQNKRRTFYMLLGNFIVFALIGALCGWLFFSNEVVGIGIACIIAVVYSLLMVTSSTSVIMRMNRAVRLPEANAPEVYTIVRHLVQKVRMPMPDLYIVEDSSPNAFATGMNPNKSAVAVTTGLLDCLNNEQLEAVLGHELSHIRHYDTRLQSISMALSSVVGILSGFATRWWFYSNENDDVPAGLRFIIGLLLNLFAPLTMMIAQMALSRQCEYSADAGSVEMTGKPQTMISALKAISKEPIPMRTYNDASSGLYIQTPINAERGWWHQLFDTHPSIEDRIAALEKM